jgi:glycosyltransferase involved in cell wall biosynthesis
MALADRGMLARYVTGIPTRRNAGGWLARPFLGSVAEAYAIPIEPALVRHVYIASVLRKAAAKALGPALAPRVGYRANALFDRCACRFLSASRVDVVVAYEESALETFRQAKRLGIKTVLDAASVHHHWQDRFLESTESKALHRRIIARKDAEIGLADQVLTVSDFARQSYLEAGVPGERVDAVPMGVEADRFRPEVSGQNADTALQRDFRFVYVGNASRLKGLDVLRDAVARLRDAGERLVVTLIGNLGTSRTGEAHDGMVRIGWMSHERLAAELPRHDVLVLPSRFDSFGMVVAEAMACGLPAIVTRNVGASEMVTPGVNGQIVPAGDTAALSEAMRWFMVRRNDLRQMARAARESAERYDWTNYRRRIVDFIASHFS